MEDNVMGYVICANKTATEDNVTFAGVIQTDYLGRNFSCYGDPGFKPYISERGAKSAIKTWKKRLKLFNFTGSVWVYTIEKVMPLTEETIKQLDAEMVARKKRLRTALMAHV